MPLRRRDALQLAALVGGTALVAHWFRTSRPLGTDVSGFQSAQVVRADRSSPAEDNPAADLTLIVFTDFRCPACRQAHPAMKQAVAADGKVRTIYKDWPIFGEVSERAARVALAADRQGLYPQVHDRLMTRPGEGPGWHRAAVMDAGGDWERLQADLARDEAALSETLARHARQAFSLGLAGTPSYLVGRFLIQGALDEAAFAQAFEQAR